MRPQPRNVITLHSWCGVVIGFAYGFHNLRLLCAKRPDFLACFSPKVTIEVSDASTLNVVRGRADARARPFVQKTQHELAETRRELATVRAELRALAASVRPSAPAYLGGTFSTPSSWHCGLEAVFLCERVCMQTVK